MKNFKIGLEITRKMLWVAYSRVFFVLTDFYAFFVERTLNGFGLNFGLWSAY
jgi:hypothetical protein